MSTILKFGSNGNWLTYNGNVLNADATVIPPLSYRFRFESPQTDSSLSGVGLYGSWNRVSDYIWDFTCNSNNPWHYNFYYGHAGNGLLPDCHLVGTSTTASDNINLAFQGQVNLKSVYISEARLTSPFVGCTSLTSFQMDNYAGGDSQLQLPYAKTIYLGVFNGFELQAARCQSLHIGYLPGSAYAAQNFTYVGSSQDPCSIIIDSMPNATNIHAMFQGGVGIGSIYLGNTNSLTNCTNTFRACTSLTQIHIDNTASVTTTWQMFQDCTSLPSCPTFDLRSCTDMSYMFDGCTSLTACPDFNVDNDALAYAGYNAVNHMYSRCTSLTAGAFDWYYKMTGDLQAYMNAYGHLPPDPYYRGPFLPDDRAYAFYSAQSTEVGWPYIPSEYWR